MKFSIAAKHARGKSSNDVIFEASDAAKKAIEKYGAESVVNATIGSIYDEDENLVCLPTVEKTYRSLPTSEIIQYAGIAGLPEFLDVVVDEACGKSKPDAHIAAIATAGGTGSLHHAIWNYSSENDTIICADWYWGAYASICRDMLRNFDTYEMFDENNKYNIDGLENKINELAKKQENVVVIINTPGHNPVGYSVTNEEWDEILARMQNTIKNTGKNIVLVVDMAYLDYAGEREEVRSFIKKFENLPKELLVILAYSMSKGYTLYGQRTGAMIGISSDLEVMEEFKEINKYTSRATWSNINRPSMRTLVEIYNDKDKFEAVCNERDELFNMMKSRADVFSEEAKKVGLKMLPYIAGFFVSIAAKNPKAICEKLKEDNIFAVPLAKGVRIAVCSVPKKKMYGIAAKVKHAFDLVEK